ncbi:hypothetical protein Trco_001974 [Trichoderma cornu-damae]|uniref:Uncharacterized protein n=1 Tax=Trichoderma cornu-damae TaxID=654480 RepID=A0A9P8QSV1_9HYPO|nr:hypothetical protein Trco_001974 [Trichoderma cornu-damae]
MRSLLIGLETQSRKQRRLLLKRHFGGPQRGLEIFVRGLQVSESPRHLFSALVGGQQIMH